MIKLIEFEKAVNDKLKEHTGIKTYGNEVIEKIISPCFFTAARIANMQQEKPGSFLVTMQMSIIFYPEAKQIARVRNESINSKMASFLAELFSGSLKVRDRELIINKSSSDFTGENNDLLRFDFSVEFYDGYENDQDEGKNFIREIFIENTLTARKEDF